MRTAPVGRDNPRHATEATVATLQVKNAKVYVPVVTLAINDNINILEDLKQGFKITIAFHKCRSKITRQPKHNN